MKERVVCDVGRHRVVVRAGAPAYWEYDGTRAGKALRVEVLQTWWGAEHIHGRTVKRWLVGVRRWYLPWTWRLLPVQRAIARAVDYATARMEADDHEAAEEAITFEVADFAAELAKGRDREIGNQG